MCISHFRLYFEITFASRIDVPIAKPDSSVFYSMKPKFKMGKAEFGLRLSLKSQFKACPYRLQVESKLLNKDRYSMHSTNSTAHKFHQKIMAPNYYVAVKIRPSLQI